MELRVVNALGVQLMHAGNDKGTLQQLKKKKKSAFAGKILLSNQCKEA